MNRILSDIIEPDSSDDEIVDDGEHEDALVTPAFPPESHKYLVSKAKLARQRTINNKIEDEMTPQEIFQERM